jgi:putative transposase
MAPDHGVSNIVRDLKANSSSFIRKKEFLKTFAWQEGFGAFSYSQSHVSRVVSYIRNQPQHDRRKTFKEEYLELLNNFSVDYDDRYLFDLITE